ncbi:MAG: ABC transporter permease, partial [Hyphomonadaceae bacterium]
MKTLLTALNVERLKLRRSLIVPLVLAAPALVGIFTFANVVRAERAIGWSEWLSGAMTIWAFFLLPLSVTALCVLLANIEHAGR